MEMVKQSCCQNCGGDLYQVDDVKWKCRFCGDVFCDEDANKQEALQSLMDAAKQEALSNLRKNLYNAVNAQYLSNIEICDICNQIKQYVPDDFLANFYSVATGNNVKALTQFIRDIDPVANYSSMDHVVIFLIRSFQTEFHLELNNLIERAYKKTDLFKYEKFSTMMTDEASKVQMGVYETKLPRDVFIAYSSKDMSYVSLLVERLEEQNLKCFVAARNLRHGKGAVENYNAALEDAMDHCRSFVFISSTNSRSIDCDALRVEIPYIQKKDVENAPSEYKYNYKAIPHKYKKPRVEFMIEESHGFSAADSITCEFFDGYERVYSVDEVANRIFKQLIWEPSENESTESKSEKTKYCAGCGHEVPLNTKFCPECGSAEFASSVSELVRLQKQKANSQQRNEPPKQTQNNGYQNNGYQNNGYQNNGYQNNGYQNNGYQNNGYQNNGYQNNVNKNSANRPAQPARPTPVPKNAIAQSQKNYWLTLFLTVFLGVYGVHRFYAGKNGTGVLYFFTGGGLFLGWITDIFKVLGGNFKDAEGRYICLDGQYSKKIQASIKGGKSPKNYFGTLLLALFFGAFGLHRFYTGHIFKGLFQVLCIVVCVAAGNNVDMYSEIPAIVCGISAVAIFVGWVLDFLKILIGRYKDNNGLYVRP